MSHQAKPPPGRRGVQAAPRGPAAALVLLLAVLLASVTGSDGDAADSTLPPEAASPASPVVVLGIDGLDPDVVDRLVSEGQMPNFARLRREGAYGRLLSSKP